MLIKISYHMATVLQTDDLSEQIRRIIFRKFLGTEFSPYSVAQSGPLNIYKKIMYEFGR